MTTDTNTTASITFDFDLAADVFYTRMGTDLVIGRFIPAAKANGIVVLAINPNGPGGGNPQFICTAPSTEAARRFLDALYGEDSTDYVELP